MEIYLVGGAVRDALLGIDVTDRDWVVVGGSATELKQSGFTQVGSDFPVFLHPDTREEYALARRERKTGPGHRGFETDSDETVTLEEDLYRRDLTVNAMAQDESGALIDPYQGQLDLQNRVLRHVSTHFTEDPLRVLRVARFAATLPDFRIHDSTTELMNEMVRTGQLSELTPERVWVETDKALTCDTAYRFFEVLEQCGADNVLWPELTSNDSQRLRTWGSDSNPAHSAMVLLLSLSDSQLETFTTRLRMPRQTADLCRIAANLSRVGIRILDLSSEEVLDRLYNLDAFRRPDRFTEAVSVYAKATEDAAGGSRIQRAHEVASKITRQDVDRKLTGPAIGKAIRERQCQEISRL